jgi:methyltransferase family protein
MNASDLNEIREAIVPVCYEVEEKIGGEQDKELCNWYSQKNSFRHGLVIRSILSNFDVGGATEALKILNLSGMGFGHQDFSICHYLRNKLSLEYYAVEHPNSPFRNHEFFVRKVEALGVRAIFRDLKGVTAKEIRDSLGAVPDIILFTEIAEHLEHGTLLRCLQLVSDLLPTHGLALMSTPNANSITFRLRCLMGRESSHWGDGTENLAKGLFGHIVYYSIPHLGRLLRDVGLEIQRSTSVNFSVHPKLTGRDKYLEQLKLALANALIVVGERAWRVPALMNAMKTLGELLYLEVRKGSVAKIPFAI